MCVCVWGGGGGGEVGIRRHVPGMFPHKIVKFRLPEMPFCAFSDEIDSKLNDPPTPRYQALAISS